MDPNLPYSNPELLKYLRGEITFDKWLENQQDESNNYQNHQTNAVQEERTSTSFPVEESSSSLSVFSSWGSAFTHGSSADLSQSEQKKTSNAKDDSITEESDIDVEEDSDEEISVLKC